MDFAPGRVQGNWRPQIEQSQWAAIAVVVVAMVVVVFDRRQWPSGRPLQDLWRAGELERCEMEGESVAHELQTLPQSPFV